MSITTINAHNRPNKDQGLPLSILFPFLGGFEVVIEVTMAIKVVGLCYFCFLSVRFYLFSFKLCFWPNYHQNYTASGFLVEVWSIMVVKRH